MLLFESRLLQAAAVPYLSSGRQATGPPLSMLRNPVYREVHQMNKTVSVVSAIVAIVGAR